MKDTAIAVYMDNQDKLLREFQWLYKSWIQSGAWITSDMVVFHNPLYIPACEGAILVPLKPLTEIDQSWADYGFINSVWFLTTPEAAFLTRYKYLMRTDHDVFLTPHFSKLRPRLATFGIGMYAQVPEVALKLVEISEKWGIMPMFSNVGSTFMAMSDLALQYSHRHLDFCYRLRAEEFPNGFGKWPGWYQGVLTMYAGNLAANAFFGTGLTLGGLDCHCVSRDEMCDTDYHIHAWHTHGMFSKFEWWEGAYKGTDMASLNPRVICDYCLLIAGDRP